MRPHWLNILAFSLCAILHSACSLPVVSLISTTHVLTVPQMVSVHLAGENIDVSSLTPAELQKFSEMLVNELNSQRIACPAIFNDVAYLDPQTFTLRSLTNGMTAEEQTITMYLPISKNMEGDLLVNDINGDWIIVYDSSDFDWNIVVVDKNETRSIWQPMDILYPNRSSSLMNGETSSNGERIYAARPVVILDQVFGNIQWEKFGGYGPWIGTVYRFAIIMTDFAGNPIYARLVLGIKEIEISSVQESVDVAFLHSPKDLENSLFSTGVKWEQIYYLYVNFDQESLFEKQSFLSIKDWSGFVPTDKSFAVFAGQLQDDQDLLLLQFNKIMRKMEVEEIQKNALNMKNSLIF